MCRFGREVGWGSSFLHEPESQRESKLSLELEAEAEEKYQGQ